jgi:hypothetical protein
MSLFYRIKLKVSAFAKITLTKVVRFFRTYPLENSMMIFGEPRSGSTWLMELLANGKNIIVVWEPTHPTLGVNALLWKGEPRIFEDPSNKHSPVASHIVDVLTLQKANDWTLRYASFRTIAFGRNTLTKFVHGTLLLPWIIENLSLNYKPVYIHRHPIAISLSQLESGMYMEGEMMSEGTFLRVYPARYQEYQQYISALNAPLKKLVAMWCLYHRYLMEQLNKSEKWIPLYYEDLLTNPADELQKITASWNVRFDRGLLHVRNPSQTDFFKQLKLDPSEQLSKWQRRVSSADKDEIQRILDYFDITLYRADSVFPIKP